MKITNIKIKNVRSFIGVHEFELSGSINLIVGRNNSGKSTILHCAQHFQGGKTIALDDKHIGAAVAGVEMQFVAHENDPANKAGLWKYQFQSLNIGVSVNSSGSKSQFNLNQRLLDREPDNCFYPYLSRRKSVKYVEGVNLANASSITGDFSHLFSKVDRINVPQRQPTYDKYVCACRDIIGFAIAPSHSAGGKHAVYYTENGGEIPISKMGEGVPNMLSLIIDLCEAKNKIFLIEEPENDLHPHALKALLRLIAESSKENQFLISTHSNIVVRQLGAIETAKIFDVKMQVKENDKSQKVFSSEINELTDDPSDRASLLSSLGYELGDFDLWDGWIIFEESSAERIVRDALIPWFADKLRGKIRTFASAGASRVFDNFQDVNGLFVFLHLTEAYKNKVWVVIDDGENERSIIKKLQDTYAPSGWRAEQFRNLAKHDFESYYPERFSEEATAALGEGDKQKKRKLKAELFQTVLKWINDDPDTAKTEFEKSAAEIIDLLREIESEL